MSAANVVLLILPFVVSGYHPEFIAPPFHPTLQDRIIHASLDAGLEPSIALDLAFLESRDNPQAVRHERDGSVSMGLFQLNGPTAVALGVQDPMDQAEAIPAAVQYLARLVRAHGRRGAVCRWRAGEWSERCGR